MSETVPKQPEWQSSIERYNKRLTIEMGSRAVLFDYQNTRLYEHAEEYRQFDHVFRVNDDGETGVFYLRDDHEPLWDTLVGHNFPRDVKDYPTEKDERVILTYFDQSLHKGMEGLLDGDDG